MCVRVCVRACACVCVRACVRVCVCVCVCYVRYVNLHDFSALTWTAVLRCECCSGPAPSPGHPMQPSQKKNRNNHCHRYQQKSVETWKYVCTNACTCMYIRVCTYVWSAVDSAGQQLEHKDIQTVPVCYPGSRRGGASASSCQLAWAVVGHSCSSTERSRTDVCMYVRTYVGAWVEEQRKETWVEAQEEGSLKISNRAVESVEGPLNTCNWC